MLETREKQRQEELGDRIQAPLLDAALTGRLSRVDFSTGEWGGAGAGRQEWGFLKKKHRVCEGVREGLVSCSPRGASRFQP